MTPIRFIPLDELGLLAPLIEELSRATTKKARASAFQRLGQVLRNVRAFEGPVDSLAFLGKATSADGARGLLLVQKPRDSEVRTAAPGQGEGSQGPSSSLQTKD